MDKIFKALGDPTRLQIVNMLAVQGEVCVCRIVEALGMNQPGISQHMAKLKQAGLVRNRKQGQWIYYSLKIEVLKDGPLEFITELIKLAENAQFNNEITNCCKQQ